MGTSLKKASTIQRRAKRSEDVRLGEPQRDILRGCRYFWGQRPGKEPSACKSFDDLGRLHQARKGAK